MSRNQKSSSTTQQQGPAQTVLLFGARIANGLKESVLQTDYAYVDYLGYPDGYDRISQLTDYTLVVVDYDAFGQARSDTKKDQEVFDKLLLNALDSGTAVCFVYYDEQTPAFDKTAYRLGNMHPNDVKQLTKQQVGFRWLRKASDIATVSGDDPIHSAKCHKTEFEPYFRRWGSGKIAFKEIKKDQFDDVIVSINDLVTGFALIRRRARIVYLPLQRDYSRIEDLREAVTTFVDCMLNYLSKAQASIPSWADAPVFPAERTLAADLRRLQTEMEDVRKQLEPYQSAKALLFKSDYDLEIQVPEFMQSHIGISVRRNETYKEDFWILDEENNDFAIVEVKSVTKGFKKSAIYSAINHRESNNLEESFPALLLVNTFLQAGSFAEKDRPIEQEFWELATKNNILIIRVLDLVRLWAALREHVISQDQIIELFTSSGWLEVADDLSVSLHSKEDAI